MATGISPSSSRVQVHPLQSRSIDDTFDEFQAEVAKETKAIQQVKTMLSNSKSCSSVTEDDSLESLLVPDAQGRLQFGDPKKRHKRTIQALVTVSSLTEAIRKLEERTRDLSPSRTTEEIHEALCTVEDGSEILRHQLLSVTCPAISEELKQAREMLDALDQVTSKYFFDPGEGKNTPTIIAYCLALVSRVFKRTAQRGASLILKLVKMFGFSIAILGGQGLNSDQEATLAGIPESIETLERKFNLDVDCVLYAVCPRCSYTHSPSYPNDTSHPVYPSTCSERKAPSEEPCGASLLAHGKPLKIFEYYPFFDWFGKFLALPGIEEYGDRFCDTVSNHETIPVDKKDQTDGRFFHEFRAHDGSLFMKNRGAEGRWFFIFNADFFNVEGNRIHGKTSSTGMMAMSCLNLPLEIRNDHAYLYMPGII
ncbi:hypothetical protein EV368DRAFT_86366 [Lentinula lateritia]|nr:hypothetical protein EV368DRAFT_86366 [Lentinula lateritia]